MMQSSASKERDRPWEESPQGWPKKHPTGHKDLSWPFTNWRKVNTVVSKCLVFFSWKCTLVALPHARKRAGVSAEKKKHPDPCLSIESIHIQPLLPADSIMAANSYIPRSGPTLMPYLRNQGMSWGTVCHWAEAYAQMPRNEASRCQKWDFLRKEGIQVVWQCVTVNCEDFSSLSQSELI